METQLRATLTIEGPLTGIARLAARLAESNATEVIVGPAPPAESAAVAQGWSEGEFHRFWISLSHKSRLVLAAIAERPAGYPVQELVRDLEPDLGGTGHVLSGALSSVGHRLKHFAAKEPIYIRDYSRGVFTMSATISELIRKEEGR